jgi:plasmid stability protein
MPSVVVRSLSEELHRALKQRAREHGRSTEAEVRAILEDVVRPPERPRLGSALAAVGRHIGGVDLDIRRSSEPPEPASFE